MTGRVSAAAAWAVASLVAAGCDPGFGMRGGVREPGRCGDDTRGTPVVGAKLEVICPPGSRPPWSLVTNAQGLFEGQVLGAMSLDCSVRVTKAGYVPREYPVRYLCAMSYDDFATNCGGLALEALLSPERRLNHADHPSGMAASRSEGVKTRNRP